MSTIKDFTKGSLNPKHVIDTLQYKMLFAQNNPDYFYPAGIWVYVGPQGQGKTLSMVQTLKQMIEYYPKAKVVSNLDIHGVDYEPFTDYSQIENTKNGIYGVIFVIDELPTLWNSLESKNIPISEMACFCQMRKDRRVILGTAQVYNRIAKPIREQLQYIIDCHCMFGLLQKNVILDPANEIEKDGHIAADTVCTRYWFHRPELYDSYDTLFKIDRLERVKAERGVPCVSGSN